jgi:hypothetical protein
MPLEMIPATPADGAELTEIFYAAFMGDFNRTMFPDTPDVTAWWEQNFHDTIKRSIAAETNEVILKVVDSDQGAIVAFAKWKCPTSADRDRHEREESVVWAPSCDGELCDRFFSGMEELHGKWMGDRPHYCMFLFCFFNLSFFLVLLLLGLSGGFGYWFLLLCFARDHWCLNGSANL